MDSTPGGGIGRGSRVQRLDGLGKHAVLPLLFRLLHCGEEFSRFPSSVRRACGPVWG